jgi:hypothetical protein
VRQSLDPQHEGRRHQEQVHRAAGQKLELQSNSQRAEGQQAALITWSKELSHVIANLRAIEWTLQEKYFAVRQKRIELFGEALRKIQLELEKRELSKVSTEKLYLLLLKYADAVKSESSETMFSLLEDSTVEALLGNFKRTSTWRA